MTLLVHLLTLYLMTPVQANQYVATGSTRARLARICKRESRCTRVGVHRGDAWASRKVYRNAVRVGWLDPEGCPFHGPEQDWSTRGAHGLMAAYHLRYLALPCLPPWVLDVPVVSAWAAKAKILDKCGSKRAHRRTVAWCEKGAR